MAQYIMLCRFTEKGVGNIKDSPKRLNDAKKTFESCGAKMIAFYAALGRYDTICIVEAPNDETMARLSLQVSSLGNVNIETLRAFPEEEYLSIVNKVT